MVNTNIDFYLELSVSAISPIKKGLILKKFFSWQEYFNSRNDQKLKNQLKKIDLSALKKRLKQSQTKPICWGTNQYPQLLAQINDPPPVLYCQGDEKLLNQPSVAIVGARKYSQYGRQMADYFSRELSGAGIIVVSGLALGIDSFAHQGALSVGGKTVAILPGGLDQIYPSSHYDLSQKIKQNGALASEMPPETRIYPNSFLVRNRIITGLTKAVLVIEAGEKSGSLATARFCAEYNRDLWAIPHPLTSETGIGANRLLSNGAGLADDPRTIIQSFGIKPIKRPEHDCDHYILKLIPDQGIKVDNLARLAKLNYQQCLKELLFLELSGKIKDVGNDIYIKI